MDANCLKSAVSHHVGVSSRPPRAYLILVYYQGNGETPCEFCEVRPILRSFKPAKVDSPSCQQRYSRTCRYTIAARSRRTLSSTSMQLDTLFNATGPTTLQERDAMPSPATELSNFPYDLDLYPLGDQEAMVGLDSDNYDVLLSPGLVQEHGDQDVGRTLPLALNCRENR
jgi:hypothetical protein